MNIFYLFELNTLNSSFNHFYMFSSNRKTASHFCSKTPIENISLWNYNIAWYLIHTFSDKRCGGSLFPMNVSTYLVKAHKIHKTVKNQMEFKI